jgi:hypothetical protein
VLTGIPQQLEAHHKKTLLWSSERSTLAAGANYAARQEFVEILNSDDNYAMAFAKRLAPLRIWLCGLGLVRRACPLLHQACTV